MLQFMAKWTFKHLPSGYFLSYVRFMTNTEVSTALRPFYFSVHPDLFEQYPCQRKTNENSLKQLNSIIEKLRSRKPVKPCNLQFYIRDKQLSEGNFRLVKIHLNDHTVRKAILTILKSCELSTKYVDTISEPQPQPISAIESRPKTWDIDLTNLNKNDPLYGYIRVKRKIEEQKRGVTLRHWLDKNYQTAIRNVIANNPVNEEILRLRNILSEKLGLADVCWDCGWNEAHFRGCLQSFLALYEQHPNQMDVLRGRTLVFAQFTGVSLDGHIMLNSGEVRHNWLDLIKNVHKYDASLKKVPYFEMALSQVLLNISVGRRKFMPKVLVGEYEKHLQQITTSLLDFRGRRDFPSSWPKTLKEYEIVVETEAGPLMVSPTGQFIVPSSCPGALLVAFITDNLNDAAQKTTIYKRNKHVERSLHRQCMESFSLQMLRKDDNVTPDLMINCCERLLKEKDQLTNLKGLQLNITTFYSVLSDGTMCIPWNWK